MSVRSESTTASLPSLPERDMGLLPYLGDAFDLGELTEVKLHLGNLAFGLHNMFR